MDADTRHQLKQNEFADLLSRVKEVADRQLGYWIAGLAVIVALFVGYRFWASAQENARARAWQALFSIEETGDARAERIRSLLADSPGASFSATAKLQLAAELQRLALAQSDRRDSLLNEAVSLLSSIEGGDVAAGLAAAARFSRATALESLGQLDQARAAYESLQSEARFEASPFRTLAQQRLNSMDDAATRLQMVPGDPPPPPAPETQPADTGAAGEPGAAEPATDAADSAPPAAPPGEQTNEPDTPTEADTSKQDGDAPAEAVPATP